MLRLLLLLLLLRAFVNNDASSMWSRDSCLPAAVCMLMIRLEGVAAPTQNLR